MDESRYGKPSRWAALLLALPVVVFLLSVGGYWSLMAWGVVGDAGGSRALGAVGPILAGFGVALGYVSLRPRR